MRFRDKFLMQIVFFLNALGLGVWFPRIPDLKAALELDIWTLSLCLVCLPISCMIGFLLWPAHVQRWGLKATCKWAGAAMMPLLGLIAFAPGPVGLVLVFLVMGQVVAMIETAINAKVNDMEQAFPGPRIMSQCHAFWSFGAMAGALLGGAAAQFGVSFQLQQVVLEGTFMIAAFLVASGLPEDHGKPQTPAPLSLPGRGLLLICFLPIGALMVEGTFLDWSVLFAREGLGASPFAASTALAVFTMSMAIMRLFIDRLTEQYDAIPVIRISALTMSIGVFGFSMAPGIVFALPFAGLAGLGCAALYPMAMSLAANQEGRSSTQNVAAVSFFGFGAFLIGPPLVGFIASQASLGFAFTCLTPLALYPIFLAGRAAQRA